MSQAPRIIPIPVSCRLTGGAPFPLTARTVITTGGDATLAGTATQLAKLVDVRVADAAPAGGNVISLGVDAGLTGRIGPEGYTLVVTADDLRPWRRHADHVACLADQRLRCGSCCRPISSASAGARGAAGSPWPRWKSRTGRASAGAARCWT